MRYRAYFALVWLGALGCERALGAVLGEALSDPNLGVSVERVNGKYLFRMKNCKNEKQLLDVIRIDVLRDVPRDKLDAEKPLCRLELKEGEHQATLTSWLYGTVPNGYVERGCQPLEPGGAFRVDILPPGNMKFVLGSDGEIRSASPMCE